MYLTTLRIINAADRTESVIDARSILHIPRGIEVSTNKECQVITGEGQCFVTSG